MVKSRIILPMDPIRMPEDFYEQSPDGSLRATEAVMNLVRTADLLLDRLGRALRPFGVTQAGGLVLGILRDQGAMPPSLLGEKLIVSRATVTGLVDSLERKGLVRRNPHPDDRRSLLVEITPEGLDVLKQLRPAIHDREKAWLSGLSDPELTDLIGMLHRVQESLDANPRD
jgi:MarR family 2-MHQ and catechol resistance regulon transcriptional repressor